MLRIVHKSPIFFQQCSAVYLIQIIFLGDSEKPAPIYESDETEMNNEIIDYNYDDYNYDGEHNNDESLPEDEKDIPACIKPATNLGCFMWSLENN